jgi:hypothetical protein
MDWTLFCRMWLRLGSRFYRERTHDRACADGCGQWCGIGLRGPLLIRGRDYDF